MSGGESLMFETHLTSTPVSDVERAALLADPGFGQIFTDHMATIRYVEGKGWHDARIEPYGPIPLSPAAAVLHYAQEIFEGMKAYHCESGGITLFRPDANARRFQASAERMSMPKLSEDVFIQALERLIEVDRAWVPTEDEASLYLRPFMFASEAFLGVRPAHEYLFLVIASPVGPSTSGCPTSTPGRPLAVRARRSAVETTRRAWPHTRRRSRPTASRWSSSTRWSTAGSRSSAV
jgi:branched-chain amino acid aminotransferase